MTTSSMEPDRLGVIGGVTCWVARTNRPWDLNIDAITVSVGSTLGGLGEELRQKFPGASWDAIRFQSITPELPQLLDLPATDTMRPLRLAVLVTPHNENLFEPTLPAIATATASAIEAADRAGVTSLGVPLLAAGVLGQSPSFATRGVVPAAGAALEEIRPASLLRLVFFCRDKISEQQIRLEFARLDDASAADTFPDIPSDSPLPSTGAEEPPTFSRVELAGGVSSDLVDPNVGIPLANDRLGFAPYVSMLATVMAERTTPLPLSVGVFGEWGSGKSYFMGLLRDQVGELAGADRERYCDVIVHIGFNAWHYADTNLWASLGDEIFRQLAGTDPTSRERAERIRIELTERLDQRQQLESATEQARTTAAALQAKIDAATANREASARDLIAALKGSPLLRERIDALWRRLGIEDEVEQGKLLAGEMRGTLSEADVLRRTPADRRGRITLAAAGTILVAGVFVAALIPMAREWLAGVGALFALGAGTGIAALARARSGLRQLRELTEDLHAGMGKAAEDVISREMADTLDALRAAEAEQRVAEAQLAEVVSQVGELGRQLTQLAPGKRLYSFLADRANSDSYAGNLGLISTIRKDFEQLVELMVEWRANPRSDVDDEPRRPVDRIVLYIDDLDRCSPRQVVDVLQAVHLLLAFELFVVVVGVDPRWLVRSLRRHYTEILDEDGARVTPWQVTPEDYLEKILNIPLVLPGMSTGSLSRLLRSMVEDECPDPSPGAEDAAAPEPGSRHVVEDVDPAVITVEQGSEVDNQRREGAGAEAPRPLTEPEIELLGTLDRLVSTPREAKRLINLYRMVRATRDLSDASRFLGEDGEPGEYQAVVVLLGLLTGHGRLLGRVLDTPPDHDSGALGGLLHRPPETPWPRFVSDLQPRLSDTGWITSALGPVPETQAPHWVRLYQGLEHVSDAVWLPDLSALQTWAPRIRRFCYTLPSADRV